MSVAKGTVCPEERKEKIGRANSGLWNFVIDYNGYVRVTISTYPEYKRVSLHRYTMELFLGRELLFDECVHHINNDKTDNRIENLEIIIRKEHGSIHGKQVKNRNRKKDLSKYDCYTVRK